MSDYKQNKSHAEDLATKLLIANKELAFENDEKEALKDELAIANKELAFENDEKEALEDELAIANKELTFENDEKEARAAELVIANKELAFENDEKEARAAELVIANKELAFENDEKEARAAGLVIANKELAFENDEKEARAAELVIVNKELAIQEVRARTSEDQLIKALMAAPIPVMLHASDGQIILINNRWTEITGYTLEDIPTIEIWTKKAYDGKTPEFRTAINNPYHIDAANFDGGFIVTTSEGQERNWLFYSTSLEDETDERNVFITTVLDITESEEAESKLRQSQKIEAVGQLTGGIAHDFNNILGIILGNIELLEEEIVDNPKAIKFAHNAYKGGERGVDITRKLLMFTRRGPSKPQQVDISSTVQGIINLFQKSLTPNISIRTNLSNDLWRANVDPGDFENAILNLAINARDAMPDGGSLTFETVNKVLDDQYARTNPNAVPGKYVMLVVSDSGTGMPPEVQEQAFQPFFTTKEKTKGTGLGLSMVYGFVQRSGGHIKIYSELGRGTTFCILFPQANTETIETSPADHEIESEPPHGTETILVVDDEESLVSIAASFLESLGYRVLTANNGNQALEVLKNQYNQIDLLFSDVVMPGDLDGYDLGKEVLKTYPNIKVLLASGFTAKPQMSKLPENILGKPYNRSELADAIRQILDKLE